MPVVGVLQAKGIFATFVRARDTAGALARVAVTIASPNLPMALFFLDSYKVVEESYR